MREYVIIAFRKRAGGEYTILRNAYFYAPLDTCYRPLSDRIKYGSFTIFTP